MMNRRSTFAFLALVTLGACARKSGDQKGQAGQATTISVKGSDTMVILGQRWAEAYMKQNLGSTIQIAGGGSGTGIAALINGSTDICQASRPLKEKEKGEVKTKRNADAVETRVALDALAVYVNAASPVKELSLPQLAKVYTGEVTNWKDFGGADHAIVLYGRENNSGTYAYFKEHVLGNKDFAASTQTLAGTSAVANAVKGDAYGIGYGGIAYLEGVHAVAIKKDDAAPAVVPSLATAQDGSYPLGRYLLFVTAGQPTGLAKTFQDWVLSPAGQAMIESVGYYPLPKG
jgi:phosphate transport system substrate-binding protein